jgi:hypothetical protein
MNCQTMMEVVFECPKDSKSAAGLFLAVSDTNVGDDVQTEVY